MHGLIFSSIQSFVTNTYGAEKWSAATRKANLGTIEFEAMLSYDARLAAVLIDAVADVLARSCEEVMEDIGPIWSAILPWKACAGCCALGVSTLWSFYIL